MTREELIAKIQDIEWDDFEAKEALNELPKNEKRLRMISLPHFETKTSSITLSSAVRTRLLLMVNWFWRSIFLRQN